MRVYFDNASTTPLDPIVYKAMAPYQQTHYGNASALHEWGRAAKVALEKARQAIAACLGTHTDDLCFTSGGTESNNTLIHSFLDKHTHLITSLLEHKAVLAPLQYWASQYRCTLHFVKLTEKGHIDHTHLADLLKKYPKTFVTLMHGNNEIGNLTDMALVAQLCQAHGATLHTARVQTLAYFPLDMDKLGIAAATGSAHKLHGPKGVGLTYFQRPYKPLLRGGAQERGLRAGTENVAAIVGFAEALCLAQSKRTQHLAHLRKLKKYMMAKLCEALPDIQFNGDTHPSTSLPHILNVALPHYARTDTVLFALDMAHIAAAAGSACNSGTAALSHVLQALYPTKKQPQGIRFSFSKYNTLAEVDYVVAHFARIIKQHHKGHAKQ